MSSTKASPQFSGSIARPQDVATDILFVPVSGADDGLQDLQGLDAALSGEWARATTSGEFRGKVYETHPARVSGGWKAGRVIFVGVGPASELDAERARRIAAICGYAARKARAAAVAVIVRAGLSAAVIADGLSAAEFDGASYRTGDAATGAFPARCEIVAPGGDAKVLAGEVHRGRAIGEASNFARSLSNEPGNVLTPREFAVRVSAAATDAGLSVDVLDETRMQELGMGLLLGVARGSAEPPRLMVLRHEPAHAPASPVLAFIGKGVTFDSGGISIKPADGMERMKDDMAGGAAVVAALCALGKMHAPFRIIGIIPATENMPGGRAIKPGDVIAGASGKTVEIINTDAEGRLILADALWYAQKLGATHLVDIATLTGACVVALGKSVSGLFGRPSEWVETIRAAAEAAGDRVWPMPIYEEASEQLRSDIADVINAAGRAGGAITAAAFLREFAGTLPWAHLDIAGTAWAETKKAYQPKGASGAAVRTLIELGMTGGAPR